VGAGLEEGLEGFRYAVLGGEGGLHPAALVEGETPQSGPVEGQGFQQTCTHSGNIQGTFCNIQGTFREHSGNIQETYCNFQVSDHQTHHYQLPIPGAYNNRYIQGTFSNIQATFREHSGNIQGTFREHSGNSQGTFREHLGNVP
jgi:hypothetical protein